MGKLWKSWTQDEEDILLKYYPTKGADATAKLLPGRTALAVNARAKRLHIAIDPERKSAVWSKHARYLHDSGLIGSKAQPEALPPEYIQASDIFQVGFRVARDMGVIHEFA